MQQKEQATFKRFRLRSFCRERVSQNLRPKVRAVQPVIIIYRFCAPSISLTNRVVGNCGAIIIKAIFAHTLRAIAIALTCAALPGNHLYVKAQITLGISLN